EQDVAYENDTRSQLTCLSNDEFKGWDFCATEECEREPLYFRRREDPELPVSCDASIRRLNRDSPRRQGVNQDALALTSVTLLLTALAMALCGADSPGPRIPGSTPTTDVTGEPSDSGVGDVVVKPAEPEQPFHRSTRGARSWGLSLAMLPCRRMREICDEQL